MTGYLLQACAIRYNPRAPQSREIVLATEDSRSPLPANSRRHDSTAKDLPDDAEGLVGEGGGDGGGDGGGSRGSDSDLASQDLEFRRAMAQLRSAPLKEGARQGEDIERSRGLGFESRRGRRAKRGRVKKGALDVAATLDLHGRSVEEALEALDRFITRSAARGHRRVLIITGRGKGSSGQRPVLRHAVPAWLREQRPAHVESIEIAPPEHGGSGAWLVRLRPPR